MHENAVFRIISIGDILPNRFQPRIKFEDDSLDELAKSISKFGVIEPIVVRPIGNKYEIIAGERRYKASKLANKATIPSIIIDLSDKDSEELALLENVQRQSLNPIEEAVSYKRILDMGYISREELSKKIGKPQSVILGKTKLLDLSDDVQSSLLNNKISERHARALLNISDLDEQVKMLNRILRERLTVKQTNEEIRKLLESENKVEKNEEETEKLFGERGNDNMDIDKMMREAQDINGASSSVTEQAPNLMENPATSQPQVVSSTNQSFGAEPNKFVNMPSESVNSSPVNQIGANGGVTFDSMFNSSINQNGLNPNPSTPSVSLGNSPVSTENVPPIVSSSQPITQPGNLGMAASNVSSLEQGTTFVNPSVMANGDVPPVADSAPSSFINPSVINSDNSMNNEISGIVSDALQKQDVFGQISGSQNSIEGDSINSIPDTNIIDVPFGGSGGSIPVNNDISVDSPLNVNQENSNSFGESLDVKQNLGSVISDPSIIQQNNVQTPSVPITDNVPDFSKIVEKLRLCADEIEKMGHFVNLEEADLGNQYKVIFTFDK